MSFKELIRKAARFILNESSASRVEVQVAQIQYGSILKDRKIIITGGGRGIGYAMAKKFVSEGAQVVIAGRNEAVLKKAASELGSQCCFVSFDVTDFSNASLFLEKSSALMGGGGYPNL